MTHEEKESIQHQIENLQRQLREDNEEKWIAEARSAEAEYLGRYFLDEKTGVLYHPVCILTPECPYQIWTVVINPISAYAYKPNTHKMYFGDKYTYWLHYTPMYCTRVFHKRFAQLTELTEQEFNDAAEVAFKLMWNQVHETFTIDNFKQKVTHYYDEAAHLA